MLRTLTSMPDYLKIPKDRQFSPSWSQGERHWLCIQKAEGSHDQEALGGGTD